MPRRRIPGPPLSRDRRRALPRRYPHPQRLAAPPAPTRAGRALHRSGWPPRPRRTPQLRLAVRRRRQQHPSEGIPPAFNPRSQLPPRPHRAPPHQRGLRPARTRATAGTPADFRLCPPANWGTWVRFIDSRPSPVVPGPRPRSASPRPAFRYLRALSERRAPRRTSLAPPGSCPHDVRR